jgi:tetratricopeptide (TPR) repeat protein
MKTICDLILFVLVFLAFAATGYTQSMPQPTSTPIVVRATTTEQAGDEKIAAGQFADAIFYYKTQWASFMVGRNDGDADTLAARERLVAKMAAAVVKLDKPLTIPENAEFSAQKGAAFINLAKTPADSSNFPKAVKEFQEAVNLAPWVFNYHFNLAVAYKSDGQFKLALNSLALAKLLAPNDNERHDALKLRAEIEAAQEMAASSNAEAEKEAAAKAAADTPQAREAALLKKVEGARFVVRHDLGGIGSYDEILEIKGGMLFITIRIYANNTSGTFFGKNRPGEYKFDPISFTEGSFKHTSDQRRIFTIRPDGQALMESFPDTPVISPFPVTIEK